MSDINQCLECESDYSPEYSHAESNEDFCCVECQDTYEEKQED